MMLATLIAVPVLAEETDVETETQTKALGIDDLTMVEGATYQLEPQGVNNDDYEFSYESTDTDIADVDKDSGVVTAGIAGDTTILVTATEKADVENPTVSPMEEQNTLTQEVKVTVIEKFEINCDDLTIEEETIGVLQPSVDGQDYKFSFELKTDNGVIKLEKDGTVEGLKSGSDKVTVLVDGIIGAEKEVLITVKAGNFYGLAFEIPNPMPAEFSEDDFRDKVLAYKYTDSDDNEVVTTVKEQLKAAFAEFNQAELNEKFMNGDIQVWEVFKYKKKSKNLMNLENMTLTYGDKANLKDKALNKDAEFTFSSSNEKVVKVDSEGNLETVAGGDAEITVSCSETKYYREEKKEIKVTVNKADQTISGGANVTKYVGETSFDIKASAKTGIIYSSDNSKVATVSDTGKVTVKDAGTAVITMTAYPDDCYNKASKSIKVTVKKPYGTTLSVKALSGKDKRKIRLTWKPVKGASKYQIYVYNTKKTVTVKTSSLVGSHEDSNGNFYFTHTKLKAGKTYKYKVRAVSYNASGKAYYGPYSSAKSAKAKSR